MILFWDETGFGMKVVFPNLDGIAPDQELGVAWCGHIGLASLSTIVKKEKIRRARQSWGKIIGQTRFTTATQRQKHLRRDHRLENPEKKIPIKSLRFLKFEDIFQEETER